MVLPLTPSHNDCDPASNPNANCSKSVVVQIVPLISKICNDCITDIQFASAENVPLFVNFSKMTSLCCTVQRKDCQDFYSSSNYMFSYEEPKRKITVRIQRSPQGDGWEIYRTSKKINSNSDDGNNIQGNDNGDDDNDGIASLSSDATHVTLRTIAGGNNVPPAGLDDGFDRPGDGPGHPGRPGGLSSPLGPEGQFGSLIPGAALRPDQLDEDACERLLVSVDTNEDKHLDKPEYVNFINILTQSSFPSYTFEALPSLLKDAYNALATTDGPTASCDGII